VAVEQSATSTARMEPATTSVCMGRHPYIRITMDGQKYSCTLVPLVWSAQAHCPWHTHDWKQRAVATRACVRWWAVGQSATPTTQRRVFRLRVRTWSRACVPQCLCRNSPDPLRFRSSTDRGRLLNLPSNVADVVCQDDDPARRVGWPVVATSAKHARTRSCECDEEESLPIKWTKKRT